MTGVPPFGGSFLEGYRRLSGPTRREWVDAMIAERDAIDMPAERRRFARGCTFALLTAPGHRDEGATVMRSVTALCAAVATGLAAFGLIYYPGLRSGSSWIPYLALFVIAIGLYTLCGAQVSKLGTFSIHRIGILAAIPALPCAWFVARGSGSTSYGVNLIVVLLPAVAAVWAMRRHRSAASGAVAAMDTALLAGLLFFVGFVWTTYASSSGIPTGVILQEFIRSGTSDYRTWSIGDNLGGACFMLFFVPAVGLPVGLLATLLPTLPSHPSTV
ncbi:MAG: hypothetical protein FWC87_14900 [Acidimicrobiaceae bacterium]|nr:hypothetical protein [Acidimicrobiaceae bacterium]